MKKTKSIKILLVTMLLSLFMVGLVSGCSDKPKAPNANPNVSTGKISIVGSTSVSPLAQEIADKYNERNASVKIDIQGVGSSAGIKAAIDGTCDIGMSSRELSESEKAANLKETVIALDGIAVIVHPSNSVADLKKEQIISIFKGEIKNWKDVGGVDKEIIVVSREAGSGTRGAFEELLKLQKKVDDKTVSLLIDNALIAEGNGSVLANVAGKANAIGYMSLGMVDEAKVKKVTVDGVEATSQSIKDKKYAIARPFLMLTKGEPTQAVKEYLEFVLGVEGQKIVAEDYISVK